MKFSFWPHAAKSRFFIAILLVKLEPGIFKSNSIAQTCSEDYRYAMSLNFELSILLKFRKSIRVLQTLQTNNAKFLQSTTLLSHYFPTSASRNVSITVHHLAH